MNCPICNHSSTFKCLVNHHCDRDFYECNNCHFCFVPSVQHLSRVDEFERYAFHENSADDMSYQNYIRGVLDPFIQFYRLANEVVGQKTHLDYGSGNSLTAVFIMNEAGFESQAYDPCFFPDTPHAPVDAITCIEVIEHFRNPLKDFEEMLSYLRPNGLLMVRTLVWQKLGEKEFEKWWYKNDPTHISIFTEEAFQELESRFPIEREYFDGKSTIIWRRKN